MGFHPAAYLRRKQLGNIMLCVTGAEALYADMGHFNALSIRVGSRLKEHALLQVCDLTHAASHQALSHARKLTSACSLALGLLFIQAW